MVSCDPWVEIDATLSEIISTRTEFQFNGPAVVVFGNHLQLLSVKVKTNIFKVC